MDTAQALAATNGIFALVCGIVGIRLLGLARRTRELPEFFLGAAFVGIVVGILTIAVSRVGRVPVNEVNLPVFAGGFGVVWLSASFFIAFTWRAFRSGSKGALGFLILASLTMGASAAGCVHAVATAPPDAHTASLTVYWLMGLRVPLMLNFAWSAIESFHHYRMARRRMAIGLGDPVTANRFLLWCGVGAFTLSSTAIGIALHLQGMGPMNHPLGAAALATGAMVPALLMTLIFMPPAAYRRFLLRRAEVAGLTA